MAKSDSIVTAQLRLCKTTTPKSELAKVIDNWRSVTYLRLQINMCLEQSGIIHTIVAYIISNFQIYVSHQAWMSLKFNKWKAQSILICRNASRFNRKWHRLVNYNWIAPTILCNILPCHLPLDMFHEVIRRNRLFQ